MLDQAMRGVPTGAPRARPRPLPHVHAVPALVDALVGRGQNASLARTLGVPTRWVADWRAGRRRPVRTEMDALFDLARERFGARLAAWYRAGCP